MEFQRNPRKPREGERGRASNRIFDLGMIGYQLVGGVHSVRGRSSALLVYRDERNKILV